MGAYVVEWREGRVVVRYLSAGRLALYQALIDLILSLGRDGKA